MFSREHEAYLNVVSFRRYPIYRLLLFICIVFLNFIPDNSAFAQTHFHRNTGTPFIHNYTPEEYGAHNQNWAIVQDKRGLIYAGNNNGVLEFDGVSWRTIYTAGDNIVRSLAADQQGRIYVGSFGEIGYLRPDSIGQLSFISLMPLLDTSYRHFTDVWQTISTSAGVFFVTPKYVFRYDGNKIHTWKAETSFHIGFNVYDQFYVRQRGKGLMLITGDDLIMAPLGETFSDERIMAIVPIPSRGHKAMLLSTRGNGLLIYDGITISPFKTEAETLLRENQVYCGTALPDNRFAFGTLQTGIVIIDDQGRLLHHINKSSGLQDESIWYLFPDLQGSLWAGMHVGISRIETGSPHTFYGERKGLEGSVLYLLRHNGILYAATNMGIYYLDESKHDEFRRIEKVAPQGWALLPFGNSVLAGTFEGVYEIRGSAARIIDSVYAMSLSRSIKDTNRVFIGLQRGFKSIYHQNAAWADEGKAAGIDDEILAIHAQPDGSYWLTTRYISLIKVDYSKGFSVNPVITRYDTSHGLPDGERTVAFATSRGTRFGTSKGVYDFDEHTQRFFPDTALIKGFPPISDIFTVTPDEKGNLWLISASPSGVAWLQQDGTYQWDEKPFMRLNKYDDYYAYPDPVYKNVIWVGIIDRVVRYDHNVSFNTKQTFATYIRNIIINKDSVLYGGGEDALHKKYLLHHSDKSIRFSFAAPFYDETSQTLYQYRLEGYDEDWSSWSSETYKDYTGLTRGEYRFLVRAKNIYDVVSDPAIAEFRILPPFYATTLAFIVYGILSIGFIFWLWRIQLKRIQKTHARELTELEFKKLKELDQLKSRFFADISHEFRTPLTLILGPVDNLLAMDQAPEAKTQFQLIRRNAQRLLRLINQLLDLSKLDAGRMKLEMSRKDILPLFRGIVSSFDSLAANKNIQLSLDATVDEAIIDFDQDKMEQVISNLISNAIKFTPEGGSVKVTLSKDMHQGKLQIDVTDTGAGIPSHQLPYVFDRFYQGDEAMRIDEPGTGIGLALAKELIALHHGQISVRSIHHAGSTFTILLPLQSATGLTTTPANDTTKSYLPYEQVVEHVELLPLFEDASFEQTLLLVEDNADMRLFIKGTLSNQYRVIEAIDGVDGLEKAIEHIPDIIISDVMMPRKDGLELCQFLKEDIRTSHIPVILLTAKADIESRLAGLKRGADDYLAKPFNKDELLIRTSNLLEGRKRLWERYADLSSSIRVDADPGASEETLLEDAFLRKIRGIVEDHLSDAEFEIDTLSRMAAMSRSQLFRKIKALTGNSPSVFIRQIRLMKARTLLENTDMNVTEVAYQVGFSTPAYFSDAFTETFGIRPSALRK